MNGNFPDFTEFSIIKIRMMFQKRNTFNLIIKVLREKDYLLSLEEVPFIGKVIYSLVFLFGKTFISFIPSDISRIFPFKEEKVRENLNILKMLNLLESIFQNDIEYVRVKKLEKENEDNFLKFLIEISNEFLPKYLKLKDNKS